MCLSADQSDWDQVPVLELARDSVYLLPPGKSENGALISDALGEAQDWCRKQKSAKSMSLETMDSYFTQIADTCEKLWNEYQKHARWVTVIHS